MNTNFHETTPVWSSTITDETIYHHELSPHPITMPFKLKRVQATGWTQSVGTQCVVFRKSYIDHRSPATGPDIMHTSSTNIKYLYQLKSHHVFNQTSRRGVGPPSRSPNVTIYHFRRNTHNPRSRLCLSRRSLHLSRQETTCKHILY